MNETSAVADSPSGTGLSQGGIETTDYQTREFHVLDLDGNLVTFFEPV
jgi:hypothetical protein